MAFDPDAYLAQGGFDPDAYLGVGKPAQPSFAQQAKKELLSSLPVQLGLGAIRGAGSIGATAMRALPNFLGGDTSQENAERRQKMDQALTQFGADTDSFGFGAGKIGAEIAGTAGIGGGFARVAAMLPGATKAAPLIDALRTGGMSAAGKTGIASLPARIAGGAAVGGASAGAAGGADDVGMGAALGGALPAVGQIARGGIALGRNVIGATTGVGDEAFSQAFKAGKQGGQKAQEFTNAMRGVGEQADALAMAKQNLQALNQQKQQAYRSGMVNVKADKTVLDFGGVDQKIKDAAGMVAFKGQIKNPQSAKAVQEAAEAVNEWKALDPAEFHTPEGMDALKQRIGAIQEAIPFEQKQAREAVGGIYNAIKGEISKQAPAYSKTMAGYSEASETIREIERALSIGQKASADTGMRKLQSLMRNNVNTNYGQRATLAQEMIQAGGQDFMPVIAGQALNEMMPRGISRAGVGVGGAGLASLGAYAPAAGLAALSSPRLMGEMAYGAGKAAGAIDPALLQALRSGVYKAAPLMPGQTGQSQ